MIETLASISAVLGAFAADVDVRFEAPTYHVLGTPYVVEVTYTAGEEATRLRAWQLGSAMFEGDSRPLAERDELGEVPLAAGTSIAVRLDIGPRLPESRSFTLGVTGATAEPIEVDAFELAPEGLDFMQLSLAELARYVVLLETNRGPMLLELWPDAAPNHVRNFLDLSYTGFYDGTQFHRVSPSFMVQGGCPNTKTNNRAAWGLGSGPRVLEAEFNDRKHERGILSMARGTSPNSASSQFFIMTTRNAALDNGYTVFGRMVSGDEALDAIANAPGKLNTRDQTIRPAEPQRIERALVLEPVPAR